MSFLQVLMLMNMLYVKLQAYPQSNLAKSTWMIFRNSMSLLKVLNLAKFFTNCVGVLLFHLVILTLLDCFTHCERLFQRSVIGLWKPLELPISTTFSFTKTLILPFLCLTISLNTTRLLSSTMTWVTTLVLMISKEDIQKYGQESQIFVSQIHLISSIYLLTKSRSI